MDRNTSTVWTFLFLAYKHGLIEKNLQILNGILDPKLDLGLILGSMEDSLSESDRALIDVTIQDTILPLLPVISDENFLRGFRILLDILQPYIVRTIKNTGGDLGILTEKMQMLIRLGSSLKPLSVLMAPAVIDHIIKQKPSWSIRFVLRRLRKKILKAKGDSI